MGLLPKVAALAALMFCFDVAQAQAQGPRAIELSAKAVFKHRHSKVELPPVLTGLPRTRSTEFEADQLDTLSEYATAGLGEVHTVYIYRNVAGGLPIWFDRARWMVEHRRGIGTATLHAAGDFVPPGRTNASGLLATYALSGNSFRSTGLALVPVGEWLVKLRSSSQSLSAAELEARMKAALAEIVWPKKMAPAPAAAPVVPCTTALALSGDAIPVVGDDKSGAAMLFGALLGQMGATKEPPKQAAVPPQARWCRDPTELAEAGVYRADEQKNGYLLAVGDAGRAITAGPSAGQALIDLDEQKKAGSERYEVQMVLLSMRAASRLLDRLPPPAQALAIVKEGRFASSYGTWGKDKGKITVGPDALK
ncbi:MAG TPA: hypothetical protein VF782_14180 [Allosphingosinicella sp.]|jgi:hypothetical protein